MQHDALDDARLLASLEDGSLPPAAFDHRTHVRAAWLYLRQHPLPEAARRCARTIQRYTVHHGVADKFHLTLTLAFMHIVDELMRAEPADDFSAFVARHPQILSAPKALIARHYSAAQLAVPAARTTFVPPDRVPLP